MEWWYVPSPCYLVVPGAALVPRSPPTIEELLWTIRDAWPPPRSLSLDSEKRDKSKVRAEAMGTGSKKEPPAQRMGLPYRRYSVPETVMRKYSLSRAQTSASDVGTAPTPSVPSLAPSSGAVRRMCHKACQTSPQSVPTVRVVPSGEDMSKHSSNSVLSHSEEVADCGACASVYKSDPSLPGAVVDSRFLRVPELILDPHDSPQVSSDNDAVDENTTFELGNSSGVNMERDKSTETDTLDSENLSSLQYQSDTHQRKHVLRSKSNSVPESSEPLTRTNRTGSADEELPFDQPVDGGELTIEQELHFEQSLSPEGTPTPAPTCHTYDSQGNMLSECYITDCEVCNAEGRKCCSLDDSGSQSCSFTSPEMRSSNELKSSTDFTTSSMTLDQTVSDRTTSTQDSTVSLTSITPESAESKDKCSNIYISPILVIDSETTLVSVSPKSKIVDEKVLAQQLGSSQSEISKSQNLSDNIPPVISCESGVVPESQNSMNKDVVRRDFETKEDMKMSFTDHTKQDQTYSELNNNKITISKDISTQVSESLSSITENEVAQPAATAGSKSHATHYLYLTESESGNTQDSVDENNKTKNKKIVGVYTTSHLYLTETESSPTEDSKEEICTEKKKTGASSTNYLYMTESESSEGIKTLTGRNEEGIVEQKMTGNYATNYLYMTESESSGPTKSLDTSDNIYLETKKKVSGSYAKNYLYMTESESPDTSKTTSSDDRKVENGKQLVDDYTTGARATDYFYMTESESSGTKTLHPHCEKESGTVRKNVGTYAENYMYMTESDSPETHRTTSSEVEDSTNLKVAGTENVMAEQKTPETVQDSCTVVDNALKSEAKSVGNFNTDLFYMTETESSDSTKKYDEPTFNEELALKRKNTGNYTSNYLYMTESESSKTNDTLNSEESKTIEVDIIGTDNHEQENLTQETEVTLKSKALTDEIKTDGECVQKLVGDAATGYLYMSESDSSGSKSKHLENKVRVASGHKKFGTSTTNYLYLTESESPNDIESVRKGSQYATSHLYMTESDSTPENNCLPSKINDKVESDPSVMTKVSSPEPTDDISSQLAGNYSKGYLYLTESESDKAQNLPQEDSRKVETKKHHKAGGTYTTNYMYITEDESSVYPDSLDIDRGSSKEEFEMDSLAINESTDESNLLENLGFCDESSTIKCQSKTTYTDTIKNELTGEITKENFYGNIKYEVIVKDIDPIKGNFKGNVMPAMDEKIGPQLSNFPVGKITTNLGINPNQNIDLLKEKEIPTDNELGSKVVDQEPTMGSVAGGTYWEIPGKELVIPRFSALPRTLSMIVNTSSMDCSSDSDLSLADSLEDSKSDDKNKGLKLYNKYDNRLVRGDIIALLPEESDIPKKTSKESQAYFLSVTGEEGEIKVEQIPEELKRKLLKRDKELRKHSGHSCQENKCKGKNCSKKSKKHHHRHCCSTADNCSKSSCKTKSLDEFSSKISKFTQWEDLGSSKDSSDTLVPSDFSEKDKDMIFQGDYKFKDVSTSPQKCEYIDNDQQNDLNCWLETVNNTCAISDAGQDEEQRTNGPADKNKSNIKEETSSNSGEIKRLENKWVQCENVPHVDSKVDEFIARLLIENANDNENTDSAEKRKFKCSEHQIPWSKDMFVQVSQDELLVQDIVDADVQTSTLTESKSIQTAENLNKEVKEKPVSKSKALLEETNKLELNLTGSPRNQREKQESEIQFLNITEDDERCKTPVLGERPDSKNESILKQEKTLYNKPSPKFNVKSTPSRRSGTLGARFKQKFEVIPEEKSGSFESSNDERKSPKPARGRRASMPSEVIFKGLGHSQNKSSDSSTSSNEKKDSEDCDHMRNTQNTPEGGDYPRRHTIHGNITSRNTKTEAPNQDKNEQSRRHTIHGSLSLTKNDAMLKQLNLLGGTLLKGRVFGKQSGVMFGRFRPINEETQVQKDERSLVEEQLERLRRDASKGREALAVARTEGEQDELLTLSKGWINFYLLRDSQDLGSDGSNAEEGSKDSSRGEDRKRATPSLKTVTVVGKSEEDLRHQFTVQINASPETCPEAAKLPDICEPHKTPSYKTPSLSPDLTLPDITPTSSPATSPPLPDTPLPQIHTKGGGRKRSVSEKYKPGRKPPEKAEKRERVLVDNDQNLRYMKLSSMKHELQTEKTYFARSGEVACSELSQSSSTSEPADSPTLPSIKWPARQLQRRQHSRHHLRAATSSAQHNPQACWTVTLAGSSGNPTQPPPDVEMRLSFSNQARGPATSQSDSGLGEDGPPERRPRGPHPHHALPPPTKHPPPDTSQWKVLLKTHQETERSSDQVKTDKRSSLPDFNFTPGTARQKKNKRGGAGQEEPTRPGSVQVQEILEHNISLHKSSLTEEEWVEGLSVTGQAITPERKPRVPTMSERDLTRQWYHRARLFH